jgi:hypothetical protein
LKYSTTIPGLLPKLTTPGFVAQIDNPLQNENICQYQPEGTAENVDQLLALPLADA